MKRAASAPSSRYSWPSFPPTWTGLPGAPLKSAKRLFMGWLRQVLEKGEVTSEASGAIARFTQPGQPISPALNKALLWRDVLAGNFTGARHRVGALASHDKIAATVFSALIQFLVGENAEAIAGFREALKQYRNTTRRRPAVLPTSACSTRSRCCGRTRSGFMPRFVICLMPPCPATGRSRPVAVRALFQVTSGEGTFRTAIAGATRNV